MSFTDWPTSSKTPTTFWIEYGVDSPRLLHLSPFKFFFVLLRIKVLWTWSTTQVIYYLWQDTRVRRCDHTVTILHKCIFSIQADWDTAGLMCASRTRRLSQRAGLSNLQSSKAGWSNPARSESSGLQRRHGHLHSQGVWRDVQRSEVNRCRDSANLAAWPAFLEQIRALVCYHSHHSTVLRRHILIYESIRYFTWNSNPFWIDFFQGATTNFHE